MMTTPAKIRISAANFTLNLRGAIAGFVGLFAVGFALVANVAVAANAAASTVTRPQHHDALNQAQEWLSVGQAQTAYDLLAPMESELAGLPAYDFLFGQAALGSGEATRAAFAFERCLSVNTLNGACRLGMARAHMALSEVVSARSELHTIAQSSPPIEVRTVVTDYLDELTGTESGHRDTRLTSYVQLGVGYDSNINNAPSLDSIVIQTMFGPLEINDLGPEWQPRRSGFNQAAFNIRYSTPLTANWRFLADGNLAATGNWDTHRYNTAVADAGLGLSYQVYRHRFTGKLQGQNYNLGGHNYRDLVGVLGQYAYAVSEQAEFSAFAQGSQLRYPGERLRDAYRYTAGLSWAQALAANRAVAYASFYTGRETNRHSNAPVHFQHNFNGLRLGAMYMATPHVQLEAGVGAEHRRYDGQESLFSARRTETAYDAYMGFNYALNRKLSLRPQYRYARTDSSIALRDYQRHTFTVSLRYELF